MNYTTRLVTLASDMAKALERLEPDNPDLLKFKEWRRETLDMLGRDLDRMYSGPKDDQ